MNIDKNLKKIINPITNNHHQSHQNNNIHNNNININHREI
jgi:hypothetical protein